MMDDSELAKAMKDKGMSTIEEILAGNLMGKFSTHVAVNDFDSLLLWAESQNERYLKMRLQYEVGMVEKDELYEWVFAHSSVFGTIVDHIRKCMPDTKPVE